MDNSTLQQLVGVYNNLLRIHTCGEDSFIFTDSMRALFNIIKNNAGSEKQKQIEEEV